MTPSPPVLWHLKVSHYNEKVRWALDYKGVPHVRRAAVPGFHRRLARKLSGGETLPVLRIDGEIVGDSARIIDRLERRYPDPPLYPVAPAQRRRALELEHFFDEQLGPYLRLLVLHHMLSDPRLLFGAFVPDLRGIALLAARAAFPLIRWRVIRDFDITPGSVERAFAQAELAAARFGDELEPSGYLVGAGFTVADLTLASLVAPAFAPTGFPYPQPQRGDLRLAPIRAALGAALGEWASEMYVRHRGHSMELTA